MPRIAAKVFQRRRQTGLILPSLEPLAEAELCARRCLCAEMERNLETFSSYHGNTTKRTERMDACPNVLLLSLCVCVCVCV